MSNTLHNEEEIWVHLQYAITTMDLFFIFIFPILSLKPSLSFFLKKIFQAIQYTYKR